MMNVSTSHPEIVPRPFPLWRRLVYLAVIAVQAVLIFSMGKHNDHLFEALVNRDRQVSVLIAENRRLREACPPKESRSGLALSSRCPVISAVSCLIGDPNSGVVTIKPN